MRYLKKRLTIVNKEKNRERMAVVINRYVKKMAEKGWVPRLGVSSGNSFFYWEAYVWMCKPNNAEKQEAIKTAIEQRWEYDENTGNFTW
jgi:hypothetical protein